MDNIQRLAITRPANFVPNKNSNRDVRIKYILFLIKLKIQLSILNTHLEWTKSTFP